MRKNWVELGERVNRIAVGVGIVVALAIVLFLVLSGNDEEPAALTTTTTTAVVATTATPAATSSTTSLVTTTTVPVATSTSSDTREAEIQEIMEFVEFRMWQTAARGDVHTLGLLMGADSNYNALAAAAETPDRFFSSIPTSADFTLTLDGILLDREDCLVARVTEDPRPFIVDGELETLVVVLWPNAQIEWRIGWRAGGGTPEADWRRVCDLADRDWAP